MKETASAGRGADDDVQPRAQPQARTEAKVVQLEHYRAKRLDESVSVVRSRLRELQRARVGAELTTGCLLRELGALQRQLRDCRVRMIRSKELE